jgi:recombination protein RecR
MFYPEDVQNLIDEFSQFPGVGPKTAQRFVFYLLKRDGFKIDRFIQNIKKIKNIHACAKCNNFSGQKICPICQDSKRDQTTITLVAEPQDLMAIEKTKDYQGLYYVLGGLIDTVQKTSAQDLKIKKLINRLQDPQIKEIVFALSSTLEGEGTTLYLVNLIKQNLEKSQEIKLTKIARGLPLGGEIEYADEITLGEALKGRKII